VMMNDPMVLEASRVLAERLMLEETAPDEKIATAFRLILCRKAGEQELALLKGYYDEERKSFDGSASKAAEFIKQGEYKHAQVEDTVSLAALMQVVHTLYNTDEAITK
jgi:hypothetical protein